MNSAAPLRIADITGQLLMLFPLLGDSPFHAYFTVGGWQLASMLIHLSFRSEQSEPLKRYAKLILVIGCVLAAGCACFGIGELLRGCDGESAMTFLGGLLVFPALLLLGIASPVLAAWYFSICVRALQLRVAASRHRREIHWKL